MRKGARGGCEVAVLIHVEGARVTQRSRVLERRNDSNKVFGALTPSPLPMDFQVWPTETWVFPHFWGFLFLFVGSGLRLLLKRESGSELGLFGPGQPPHPLPAPRPRGPGWPRDWLEAQAAAGHRTATLRDLVAAVLAAGRDCVPDFGGEVERAVEGYTTGVPPAAR